MTLKSELAKLLLSDKWYSTSQLAILCGQDIRPEVAWRRCRSYDKNRTSVTVNEGKRRMVQDILDRWHRNKIVERKPINNYVEWRAINYEWLKEQL